MRAVTSLTGTGTGVGCENKLVGVGPSRTSVVGLFYKPTWLGVECVWSVLFEQPAAGMEGPTRPGFQKGDGVSAGKENLEGDYFLRIMRSLTESSTTLQAAPVPSQSTEEESGIGSRSHSFSDSYSRIPDISPGLNPWSYFPPPPELPGLVVVSSEPSWMSTMGSPPVLSPIQLEILADFPWLNNDLDIHRRLMNSAGAAPASSSEVGFPRLTTSKEESDVCTSVSALEPSIETHTTDQVEWAQSMLELQAFENSTIPDESRPATRDSSKCQRIFDRAASHLHDRSSSLTAANSETPFNSESLSSSLSDGDADPNKDSRRDGEDAACTSAQSEKRKRTDAEQEDGEDAPSDDQETEKLINRPRKKGGMKRVREPRYAIKTMTDTEVMEDGYKWRKYGQKAVKNSPHPRNYYRCTTLNCPVRKRVERCFEDPGLVVTTYEGTHTHKSPSFLRGPPGYPGGSLQALLATLTHHYTLAGNAPLMPFPPHSASGIRSSGPLSRSELYRSSSPSCLSQPQSQGAIQENLNLLRAHEQLLKLQQETDWASSIKSKPEFQFSFSNVTSLSNLSYDSRMSHYDSLTNSSVSEQLAGGGSGQFTSMTHSAGPFTSVLQQPFGRRPDQYVTDLAVPRNDVFRAGPQF